MTGQQPTDNGGQEGDYVMQDGVSCPKKAPWDGPNRLIVMPGSILMALGIYILVKTSLVALIIWLLVMFVLVYPLRYLVCARCPYYGQDCWSGNGKIVPRMFKKQEGKSMVLGLWLDVVLGAIILFIPLSFAIMDFGTIMAIAWFAAFFFMFMSMTRFGCSKCPFIFCPIGKAGRAFWGLFKYRP